MSESASPLLLHIYPTFDLGGAQRRFVQLANHFGPAFRHRIIALRGGKEAFALLSPDLDAAMIDPGPQSQGAWANLRHYRRLLTEIRPDLLVTSNWGSIEWALANLDGRIPHLHMEDGFGPEEADGQLPRRVWTRRLALRRSRIMLPSQTLLTLARERWKLPPRTLIHLPNGIDCQRFTPKDDGSLARSFGIALDRPVIGTVAALRREKNVGRLIESFALVPAEFNAQLVIVGDGPERQALEQLAQERNVAERVLFTGGCNQPEELLPHFTLFALTSDTEQMPLSLLEAMAAGRPVVATKVGDVAAMVAVENRPFLADLSPTDLAARARTSQMLADHMTNLLRDTALAQRIGAANQSRARCEFDQERMFTIYRRLFTPGQLFSA